MQVVAQPSDEEPAPLFSSVLPMSEIPPASLRFDGIGADINTILVLKFLKWIVAVGVEYLETKYVAGFES